MKIKLMIILFIGISVSAISWTLQEINLKSGLVACYPFNGNANDISGNNNHGEINGAVLTTDRHGNKDAAFYFNGNSNILIPNSSSLSIAKQFSFTVWFKADQLNEGQVVFAKSGDRTGLELKICNPEIQINNGHCCPITYNIIGPSCKISTWYFIAITFDGSFIRVYIDNKKIAEVSDTEFDLNYNMAEKPLRIGVGMGGKYYPFFGTIDDICVYNRAISPKEISALYNMKQLKF